MISPRDGEAAEAGVEYADGEFVHASEYTVRAAPHVRRRSHARRALRLTSATRRRILDRMPHPLVICIGNVARGDDGVAHRVAALLEDRLPAGARARRGAAARRRDGRRRRATPAPSSIVDAERRDAPAGRRATASRRRPPASTGTPSSPGHLLDIACALVRGRARAMMLVTLAAPEMEHGVGLSRTAEAAAAEGAVAVLATARR